VLSLGVMMYSSPCFSSLEDDWKRHDMNAAERDVSDAEKNARFGNGEIEEAENVDENDDDGQHFEGSESSARYGTYRQKVFMNEDNDDNDEDCDFHGVFGNDNNNNNDERMRRAKDTEILGLESAQATVDWVPLEAKKPELKLEVLSKNSITRLLLYLFFIYLLVFVSLIFICRYAAAWGLFLEEEEANVNVSQSGLDTLVVVQLTSVTVAAATTTFLLIAFPQRIIRNSVLKGKVMQPEQMVIILLILLIQISPLFGIAGAFFLYESVLNGYAVDDSSPENFIRAASVSARQRGNLIEYGSLLSALVVSFMLYFWGMLVNIQGVLDRRQEMKKLYEYLAKKDELFESSSDEDNESGDDDDTRARQRERRKRLKRKNRKRKRKKKTSSERNGSEENGSRYEIESRSDNREAEESLINQMAFPRGGRILKGGRKVKEKGEELAETIGKQAKHVDSCAQRFLKLLASYCVPSGVVESSFQNLWHGLARRYLTLLFIHWMVLLITSLLFDYTVSIIPLVGMITVLRVCLVEFDENYCSPREFNGVGFERALSVVGSFLVEIFIFMHNFRLIANTRKALKMVPYGKARSVHLGFYLFQSISFATWSTLLLFSIFTVSFSPVQNFVNSVEIANDGANITFTVNPLHRVGIDSLSLGFASVYLIISMYVFLLASAYLPPDSRGLRGWFCMSRLKRTSSQVREQPPYFLFEEDIVGFNGPGLNVEDHRNSRQKGFMNPMHQLRSIGKRWKKKKGRRRSDPSPSLPYIGRSVSGKSAPMSNPLSQSQDSADTLGWADDEDDLGSRLPSNTSPLFTELEIRSFVLEHELRMLNLAGSVYLYTSKSTPHREEVMEDKRFRVIHRIQEEGSDTHGFVAYSERRVVVCFRGTLSSANVQTDLKTKLVEHPLSDWARRSQGNLFAPESRPLRVHQGFLEVYTLIQQELAEIVEPLVLRGDRQIRILSCTGHSLGGALAVLTAFDFTSTIIDRNATVEGHVGVTCTTFGCPRIGNYSFAKAYEHVVPGTRRFVMAGDPISKTPVNYPVIADLTGTGHRHVGLEILLDLAGNVIVSPTLVERFTIDNDFHFSLRSHQMNRYALALMLWSIRVHGGKTNPVWSAYVANLILDYGSGDLKRVNKKLKPELLALIYNRDMGEVIFRRGHRKFQNRGLQVDWEEEKSRQSARNALTGRLSSDFGLEVGFMREDIQMEVETVQARNQIRRKHLSLDSCYSNESSRTIDDFEVESLFSTQSDDYFVQSNSLHTAALQDIDELESEFNQPQFDERKIKILISQIKDRQVDIVNLYERFHADRTADGYDRNPDDGSDGEQVEVTIL